jgi:hypothetical protein
VLPGSGHAGKVFHGRRGPHRDRHSVAEGGVGPGDRSCRRGRQRLAGQQLTDARGGRVKRGRVGRVDRRDGCQHRLEQTATADEIEVRAGRHVEPRRDAEPGACEAGQRGALTSDRPGHGARVVQSHHQRHLSTHEIPPAVSVPDGGGRLAKLPRPGPGCPLRQDSTQRRLNQHGQPSYRCESAAPRAGRARSG